MAGKNTAVFGIYSSGEHAERAVDTLIKAGFSSADISVLLPDTRSTKEFAHVKETKAPKARRPAQLLVASSAGRWAYSLESGLWRSQG